MKSFRLKIAISSVVLSGIVVIAFGAVYLAVFRHMAMNRIDTEITALGESSLRGHTPPEYWENLRSSLYYIYGEDFEQQIILKVMTHRGHRVHASEGWPGPVLDSLLELPEESDARDPPPQRDDFHPRPNSPRDGRAPPRRPGPGGRPAERRATGHLNEMGSPEFQTVQLNGIRWRIGQFKTNHLILSIGFNLAEARAEGMRLALTFLIAIPIALLLLGVTGWMLACRALSPVNMIARTADLITAEDLSQRIPTVRSDEEFEDLINTINTMLGRLETSFKQAARFSADAAHELKTPLTILQGNLDQAIQETADGSEAQRMLSDLLDETVRLRAITSRLLLLAQADSGQLQLSRSPTDFSEQVTMCVEDATIQAPSIEILADIQPGVWVMADQVMVRQVLTNLLNNAMKYNNDDAKMEISLTDRNGHASLVVANTGDRIPRDERDHIFERFFRLDEAHSRKKDGTGLGLSLAREIARGHGGELSLEPSPTGWNAFALRLPSIDPPRAMPETKNVDAAAALVDHAVHET